MSLAVLRRRVTVMSKKRGYRSELELIDEVIPEEVKEEVIEEVEKAFEEVEITVNEEAFDEYTYVPAKVTAFTLNVRENPSAEATVIRVIGQKDNLAVCKENDEWYHVILADGTGTKGYCMSKFIEVIN